MVNKTIDEKYLNIIQDILDNGHTKGDRTGTGTLSVFGRQIRHDMRDGFPLLTTKKMAWKTMVVELIWFLRGDTNIKYLVDNGSNIWNGDCYKNYVNAFNEGRASGLSPMCKGVPDEVISYEDFIDMIKNDKVYGCEGFTKKWGDLGPIYGKQWRSWETIDTDNFLNSDNLSESELQRGMFYKSFEIDQIKKVINQLKNEPDSRRIIVNAWNVGQLDDMVLPPCHNMFQFYTRELTYDEMWDSLSDREKRGVTKSLIGETYNGIDSRIEDINLWVENFNKPRRTISLMWNQRSVDTGLGLPFNIASYGLLLLIVAKAVNMVPEEIIGNFGDTHLYLNHIEPIKEQLDRKPFKLPKVVHGKTDAFYNMLSDNLSLFNHLEPNDFILKDYEPHDKIVLPLSN